VAKHLLTVVSASRRCDLPACHPDELVAALAHHPPETVHTLVLWTKDPRPMADHADLRRALSRYEALYLHLTVTGLGGTILEPGVPPWRRVLGALPGVFAALPNLLPGAVELRYDPLIRVFGRAGGVEGNLEPDLLRGVAAEVAGSGVTTVRTSVLTLYPKVVRRLADRGLTVDPRLDELAGSFITGVMAPICDDRGLTLLTCVRPEGGKRGCIDGPTLTVLHPAGRRCSRARDRSQRGECRCTVSKDIGSYRLCPHGCLYCYGHPDPNARFRA
jgi:hypothetical protein